MKHFGRKKFTWSLTIASTVASALLVSALPPLAQTAQASSILYNQDITLAAGQETTISVNLTQGSLVRMVTQSEDPNFSEVWTSMTKPDGSLGSSVLFDGWDRASDEKNTMGKNVDSSNPDGGLQLFTPQTGAYQFRLFFLKKTTSGKFNLKFLQVAPAQSLGIDKSITLNFAQKGEGNAFTFEANKGDHIRFVTQSAENNSEVREDIITPEGKTEDWHQLRMFRGGGTQVQDFYPKQTGKYTFLLHYRDPANVGTVEVTALTTEAPLQAVIGRPTTISFTSPGEVKNLAIKMTRGYTYRLVTYVKDSNSSVTWAGNTTENSEEFIIRQPGAGTQVYVFDPITVTGEKFYSIHKDNLIETGELTYTFLRDEKPKFIKGNTPTQVNFEKLGQGISLAFAVNKGDLIQLQTESAVEDLIVSTKYVRPDGTVSSSYTLRGAGTGKQIDSEWPFAFSQTGFYVMTLTTKSPATTGKLTLTILGSTNNSTDFVSKLGTPEEIDSDATTSIPNPPTEPVATQSPSPAPTSSKSPSAKPTATSKPVVKNPATKIPFKVELRYAGGVDTSSGDLSKSANISGKTEWVYLNYHGNLNDKTTKPTGLRFYIKDPTNNVRTLIGAVALTTTKDVTGNEKPTCSLAKGKSVTYDCRVSFNPENNGVAPKSKIQLYAAPYNSAGESSTLHPISLFPIMDTKAFVACLENGVNKTKKELTAVFTGIIIDEGADQITNSLNFPNQFYQQGTKMAISFTFREILSPTEVLKNLTEVASGAAISNLNKLFFNKTTLKIGANVLKAAATISSAAISGIAGAVDIYVAGKNAQYRISNCESNNPN